VLLGSCSVIAVLLTLAGGREGWGVLFVYLPVMAGFSFEWRRALLVLLALAGLTAATAAVQLPGLAVIGYSVLSVMLTGVGMIGIAGLVRANIELRRAREEIARLAVAEERLRFARDLHDLLGHSLSVIVLKAELADKIASRAPERAASEVRDIERVARDALREVREAVAGYRQPSLSQELESARAALAAAGIDLRIDLGTGGLPGPLDNTLAWTVREGITNIIRHSGATRATLTLTRRDGIVTLTIGDDGRGGEAVPGSGLRGLVERLAARGGDLKFGSRPRGGFELTASVPLQETSAPEVAEENRTEGPRPEMSGGAAPPSVRFPERAG
jgi:two-component system sensor histidine kinase DesK